MKFAICQELFEGWDWESQCQFIAKVGYTGIEVAPFSLAPRITDVSLQTRQTLGKQAAECGLEVVGLHWLLAKTEGFHLTSSDAAVRQATSAYLSELGAACADLGGHVLVFGSPGQRSFGPEMSRGEAYGNAASVFRACMPRLADRGVRLCMEPLTPQETNFVNTCEDAVELMRLVDHPNFVLHQDVKAMLGSEREPIPDLIERHANILGHFHGNETNLLGPGMGPTDYRPIFQAIAKVDYSGWVSVEAFDSSPGIETIARTSFEYMHETLQHVLRA